jgi:predicted GNAT family acetyltransferase
MSWQLTADVEEFRRAADRYLARDAARNTVLLTVTESLRQGGGGATADPALFGWWREADGAEVTGAFMRTPPQPPYLGPMSDSAARELAAALREVEAGPEVSGVRGETPAAEAFAGAWTGSAANWRTAEGLRLFRLGELTPVRPAPAGRARLAVTADVPLAARWMTAFQADVHEAAAQDHRAMAAQRIATGRLLFWETDGVPVSMAARSPLIAGQIRIAPVYTPAPLRGRGYAGAVTAALSQEALDAGAEQVLLFTDTANPTSNALYRRLGYRPVAEYALLHLGAAT